MDRTILIQVLLLSSLPFHHRLPDYHHLMGGNIRIVIFKTEFIRCVLTIWHMPLEHFFNIVIESVIIGVMHNHRVMKFSSVITNHRVIKEVIIDVRILLYLRVHVYVFIAVTTKYLAACGNSPCSCPSLK